MNKKLAQLQNEYNEILDRMSYMHDARNLAAANRTLDRIVAKMDKLMEAK